MYIINPPQERQATPTQNKMSYLEAGPKAKHSHPRGKAAHSPNGEYTYT